MTASRIKAIAVFVLMAIAFGGAVAWKPTQHLADQRAKIDLETLFPKRFGDWMVDDRMPVQLVSPDTEALLNKLYNQTLSRTYVNSRGERIMLSIAYGGDQSDATRAHRPEVCYPAQGFQVLANDAAAITAAGGVGLPVRRLVTRLGGRVEPVTYWIMVGERVALGGTQQKLFQLSYSVRGVIPDGMLVRVSSIDSDSKSAYELQEQFVREMFKAVPAAARIRIFGQHDLSAANTNTPLPRDGTG